MWIDERGPDDGTAIVFLHGSMVAGWMWTEQVAALSSDHRILVPDLPGIGASGSEQWTGFSGVADAVAHEIEARAPGGAHVVGLSLGGIIALNLAVDHPRLCTSLLVSGVPAGSLSLPLRLLNRAMAGVYGTRRGARVIARVLGMPDEDSIEAFVETARSTDRSAIASIVAEVSRKPLPDHLERISAPPLAVVGAKDSAPARTAIPELSASVPGARGALGPGVGHQWNAEAPELSTEMVRQWVNDGSVHPDLIEQ